MKRLTRRPLAAAVLPLLSIGIASVGIAFSTAAWAEDPPADSPGPQNAKQLQQVVVTGTRSTDRTAAESLSPIDII